MEDIAVINALVGLTKSNVSALAREIGYQRQSLLAALAGRRNLPDAIRPALFRALGVERGELRHDVVHFWVVGADIRHLVTVAKAFFPDELEIAGIWREGGGVWDPRRLADNLIYAVYGNGIRIIIVRELGVAAALGVAKSIGPETVPSLRWRGGKVGPSTMVKLAKGDLNAWVSGEISVEDFDRALRKKTKFSWDDVRTLAERRGVSPDACVDWLLSKEEK